MPQLRPSAVKLINKIKKKKEVKLTVGSNNKY